MNRYAQFVFCIHVFFYRTCAVISRGLYNCIFLTKFFTTVYIVERLVLQTIYVPKKGNSSIFGPKIRVLKSRAGYNGARTVSRRNVKLMALWAFMFTILMSDYLGSKIGDHLCTCAMHIHVSKNSLAIFIIYLNILST